MRQGSGTAGHRSWRLKGKLKVLTILLFIFSALFITYQVISYISLTNYQAEEVAALRKLSQKYQDQRERDADYPAHVQPDPADKHNHDDLAKYYTKRIVSRVLGVPEANWKYYTKPSTNLVGSSGALFTCIDSGRKISWEYVNDDFCDCPADGSDEPSTSACMNGRFYCTKKAKHFPELIPSTRVNDGVCDCCDGSDEFFTSVHCKKHC